MYTIFQKTTHIFLAVLCLPILLNAQGNAKKYPHVTFMAAQTDIADFINDHAYTVIAFTTTTCGACKVLDAIFNEVGKQRKDVTMTIANLDIVGKRKEAVKKYKLTCYPTLVFFKNGKEVQRIEGSLPVDMLLPKVNNLFRAAKKVTSSAQETVQKAPKNKRKK